MREVCAKCGSEIQPRSPAEHFPNYELSKDILTRTAAYALSFDKFRGKCYITIHSLLLDQSTAGVYVQGINEGRAFTRRVEVMSPC